MVKWFTILVILLLDLPPAVPVTVEYRYTHTLEDDCLVQTRSIGAGFGGEEGFLSALRAKEPDLAARNAYCDWLNENGMEERWRFIQESDGPEGKITDHVHQTSSHWLAGFPKGNYHIIYRDGVPDIITHHLFDFETAELVLKAIPSLRAVSGEIMSWELMPLVEQFSVPIPLNEKQTAIRRMCTYNVVYDVTVTRSAEFVQVQLSGYITVDGEFSASLTGGEHRRWLFGALDETGLLDKLYATNSAGIALIPLEKFPKAGAVSFFGRAASKRNSASIRN